MGTLTIRIADRLEADLEQLARAQHRTKSDLAREVLRQEIALAKFRALRRKAVPLAEAAEYLTDEDVFLDTNVLASALATRGLCADLLQAVAKENVLLVGAPVLEELPGSCRDPFDYLTTSWTDTGPFCSTPENSPAKRRCRTSRSKTLTTCPISAAHSAPRRTYSSPETGPC